DFANLIVTVPLHPIVVAAVCNRVTALLLFVTENLLLSVCCCLPDHTKFPLLLLLCCCYLPEYNLLRFLAAETKNSCAVYTSIKAESLKLGIIFAIFVVIQFLLYNSVRI
ncbi:hypothetical protein GIB67_005740, partial [Kingdonia uniflora]